MKIKNISDLISNGDIESRKIVLDISEQVLQRLDAEVTIRKVVHLDGDLLKIGDSEWDISKYSNIYILGAGKACNSMIKAVYSILGNKITHGIGIVKKQSHDDNYPNIEIHQGGHPIPNLSGLEASQQILELVDSAKPTDLFISLISGGSSALMNFPIDGISLEDEQQVSRELLNAGARIMEINAVRRHISQTNGGRLAQRIEQIGAELINLIIWDVVGDELKSDLHEPVSSFFGTPVAADNTTVEDAIHTIDTYKLWNKLPKSVISYLRSNSDNLETPKTLDDRISHFILQVPAETCETTQIICEEKGISNLILSSCLEGDSRGSGIFLSAIVREINNYQRPIAPPCLLIVGGESTVTVGNHTGKGGPNQELVLSFAQETSDLSGVCIAAIGTDGTDGPTLFAGGIADSQTEAAAIQAGIKLSDYLSEHNVYKALKHLGIGIITGNTGTNLCDLILIYIPDNSSQRV